MLQKANGRLNKSNGLVAGSDETQEHQLQEDSGMKTAWRGRAPCRPSPGREAWPAWQWAGETVDCSP